MMKRLFILPSLLLIFPVLLLTLLFGTPAISADFQKGQDTYDKEGFENVLKEWMPLAYQGDASAQTNLGVMYANAKGTSKDYIRAHNPISKRQLTAS